MNKDYVLILGAGLMQKPAIEAARELGYRTLVVDANASAVCVPHADRFEKIDLKDKEKLAQLALSMGTELKAVFTCGTDFSASVAYVAEKCGFTSHSLEACLNASHKVRMRQCFKDAGVSSPDFMELNGSNWDKLLSGDTELSYPMVAKPVDNMGARGCRMIRNREELKFSLEDAAKNSRSGTVILEDYMEGPEFSIDAVVYNGSLTITGFADRHIYFPPYFIETGHTMPSSYSQEVKNELILCFAKAVKSLGLTAGVAKADIKYTANGPMVGEIAARLSGGYMSGWTYPYASGLNLTKQALQIALGQAPAELLSARKKIQFKGCEDSPLELYEVECACTSAERAWISIPGKISKAYGIKEAELFPFVRNVMPRVKEGDSVDFPRNNVEKCGNVITVSASGIEAVKAAEAVCASIVLRLEEGTQETFDYLDGKESEFEKGFPYSAFEEDSVLQEFFMEFSSKKTELTEKDDILSLIPEDIADRMKNLLDYNHRSMYKALKQFTEYAPETYRLQTARFFRYLIRGSVQGILFYADSGEKSLCS